ncbi:hypothetical protein [Saccharopolyspora phatthalungensis]|uniref:Uncharacterized protein n=1 Tax=Saccharopolyspora phatthalungensis TaxID=664693 RepID=A0A840Q6P4_9PSEU|nr:hypothetical protein [Saccharopolyspora phatthalungensis]MBB5154075.1 hypothetical protein [Saccharopolyspora phatthalungensis]
MWPTEDPTEMLRWRIPCTTPGFAGIVTVLVVGDRVAVVLPPGETLIFTADEADDLAALLDQAAVHASRGA